MTIKNSVENRNRILRQIQPIIQNIQILNPEFEYEAGSESFIYKENRLWLSNTKRYTDYLISELSEVLEKVQNEKIARDTYKPMYQEMENTLNMLDISINYSDTNVTLEASTPYGVKIDFGHESVEML